MIIFLIMKVNQLSAFSAFFFTEATLLLQNDGQILACGQLAGEIPALEPGVRYVENHLTLGLNRCCYPPFFWGGGGGFAGAYLGRNWI